MTNSIKVHPFSKDPILDIGKKLRETGSFTRYGNYFASANIMLSPVINSWLKFFSPNKNTPIHSLIIWTNEEAQSLDKPYLPIPKNSFIHKCMRSNNPKYKQILEKGEKILIRSYLEAEKFFNEKDKEKIPLKFELVGEHGFGMETNNARKSIQVAYPSFNRLLFNIWKNNKNAIDTYQIFFKSSFAHEMTHFIREELEYNRKNRGLEIATHIVEILASDGEHLMVTNKYAAAIEKTFKSPKEYRSYRKDIVHGLLILHQILSEKKECLYKPKDFFPDELHKAIKSIPENIREGILKDLAQSILNTPSKKLIEAAKEHGKVLIKQMSSS